MKTPIPAKPEAAEPPKASEASVARAAPVVRRIYPFVRAPVYVACTAAEDRTQQQFRDECNINVLMKRYEKTGILPIGRDVVPQYLDCTAIDFAASAERVAQVRGAFSMLDARTRARFENNPELLLDFMADPANREEAVKLGLIVDESKGEKQHTVPEGVELARERGKVFGGDDSGEAAAQRVQREDVLRDDKGGQVPPGRERAGGVDAAAVRK